LTSRGRKTDTHPGDAFYLALTNNGKMCEGAPLVEGGAGEREEQYPNWIVVHNSKNVGAAGLTVIKGEAEEQFEFKARDSRGGSIR